MPGVALLEGVSPGRRRLRWTGRNCCRLPPNATCSVRLSYPPHSLQLWPAHRDFYFRRCSVVSPSRWSTRQRGKIDAAHSDPVYAKQVPSLSTRACGCALHHFGVWTGRHQRNDVLTGWLTSGARVPVARPVGEVRAGRQVLARDKPQAPAFTSSPSSRLGCRTGPLQGYNYGGVQSRSTLATLHHGPTLQPPRHWIALYCSGNELFLSVVKSKESK